MRRHDGIFKSTFQNPQYAAAVLRHVLDRSIAQAIDWSSLTLESGEFIDEALKDRHSDLVFSARTTTGSKVLIYLLLEHQSTPDDSTPLRLRGYSQRTWERFNAAHPGEPLPLIIPVLISQVSGGWPSPTKFSAMFPSDAPRALLAEQHEYTYTVLDLAETSDAELKARALQGVVGIVLCVMRDARDHEELMRSMQWWGPRLTQVIRQPSGKAAAFGLMTYIALALEEERYEEFCAKLTTLAPTTQELTMTAGEKLIAQGHAKGHAEGQVKGHAEGQAKGQANMLLLILKGRGIAVSASFEATIRAATSEQLETWGHRALAVNQAEELLEH